MQWLSFDNSAKIFSTRYSQIEYSQQESISKNNIPFFNSMDVSDYTAILSIGQTPYQLGPFFRGGGNGWSWWDADISEMKNRRIPYLL